MLHTKFSRQGQVLGVPRRKAARQDWGYRGDRCQAGPGTVEKGARQGQVLEIPCRKAARQGQALGVLCRMAARQGQAQGWKVNPIRGHKKGFRYSEGV